MGPRPVMRGPGGLVGMGKEGTWLWEGDQGQLTEGTRKVRDPWWEQPGEAGRFLRAPLA